MVGTTMELNSLHIFGMYQEGWDGTVRRYE